ncbi:MAG: ssl1498 family light-harvesting-like protein [Pleurocapsa sp. MO_192.B19]|nr:ssl1498 family light-harvesting-like protein [Pleurocapsa sp. MO_192.B19]
MTTVTDENGIMNNFASEPQMYYAEAPSSQDKRNYVFWGAIAMALVTSSIFTAIVVS